MPKKQSIFIKYRNINAYKSLKIIKDDTYNKLKDLYENNIWDLKNKFKYLDENNKELNINQEVSFLNDIQYLDYPTFNKLKFNDVKLSAFKNAEYKNKYTTDNNDNSPATETAYANRIIFFSKNLPSFKQYEGQDDIKWVVEKNRLLFYEILKYHNDKGNTLATIQKDLKSIMRVILLLLGEKNELRLKYPVLQTDIKEIERLAEDDNKIQSKSEINTFVPYENLLDLLENINQKYIKEYSKLSKKDAEDGKKHSNKIFSIHMEYLALALYVYDFPSRNEKMTLQFIKDDKDAIEGGNYVNISGKYCKIILNTDKKKHKPITYTLNYEPIRGLNNRLCRLLKFSYNMYPRKYLFIDKNNWDKQILTPITPETVSTWLKNLIPNKNIGINGLRSAFVSYYYEKFNNNQKRMLINRMRTSQNEVLRNYLKKYNNPDQLVKVKLEPTEDLYSNTSIGTDKQTAYIIDDNDNVNKPVKKPVEIPKLVSLDITKLENKEVQQTKQPVKSIHERKREAAKKYYEANKEKVKKRISKTVNTLETVSKRYVRELGKGMLIWSRLADSTKDKYQLYMKDGQYYSRLIK